MNSFCSVGGIFAEAPVTVWRESMRVVPTLGLRSIVTAAAMLDDPATVAVIGQQSESRPE